MTISSADIEKGSLWVAEWEGPYHVSPGDIGGPTAWGIALTYHPHLTDAKLQVMTKEEGAAFLATRYMPRNATLLPSCLATPLLAFSVLEDPSTAVMALQGALGVGRDGQIGPITAAAAAAVDPKALLRKFFRACMEHLQTRPDWGSDGAGWSTRQMAASLEAF